MAASYDPGLAPPRARTSGLLTASPRGFGTPLTIVKTAVACSLAYLVASQLGGNQLAIFAPILALVTVQESVYGTVGQGVQKIAGNMLGVVLATLWIGLVGSTWWSLGIAVGVAIVGARLLPIGYGGQMQIPLSVLLVVALGPVNEGYGVWRAIDCLIGGAIGIAVALAVPERPAIGPARAAVRAWAEAVIAQVEHLADEISEPPRELAPTEQHAFIRTSRELAGYGRRSRDALAAAAEGLRYNLRAGGRAAELAELAARERAVARSSLQVRTLALTLDRQYDRPGPPMLLRRDDLADVLREIAAMARLRVAGLGVVGQSAALKRRLADLVEGVDERSDGAVQVLESISLLGRLDQLRREVAREQVVKPPPSALDDDPEADPEADPETALAG